MLGIPDIDSLGVLTINCENIGRQVASDQNTDNSKRNCQCKREIQTDNTAESSIVTNPMVISNSSNQNSFSSQTINKDSNSFLSELIIKEKQNFVSGQLRKDNMVAADAKVRSEIHTNDS